MEVVGVARVFFVFEGSFAAIAGFFTVFASVSAS